MAMMVMMMQFCNDDSGDNDVMISMLFMLVMAMEQMDMVVF